jgi:DnaJ-class molecular chaperone
MSRAGGTGPHTCPQCHGTGKIDRGNGTTKPCDCPAGLLERLRRKALAAAKRGAR